MGDVETLSLQCGDTDIPVTLLGAVLVTWGQRAGAVGTLHPGEGDTQVSWEGLR